MHSLFDVTHDALTI